MPGKEKVRLEVLDEAHKIAYSVHPGITKMYRYLRRKFWWHGMKQDVARYVGRCMICQQVKEVGGHNDGFYYGNAAGKRSK